ncbi:MAG: hypothetical protein R3E32_12555 [Chitinophagales bacterium]
MRLTLRLLMSLFLLINTSNIKADIKWMLMGIVVQKENFHPLENMDVCIEVIASSEHICVTTLTDGFFQFPLEIDKEYLVQLIDHANNIVNTKKISTFGKEESGIMHLVLDY